MAGAVPAGTATNLPAKVMMGNNDDDGKTTKKPIKKDDDPLRTDLSNLVRGGVSFFSIP